MSETLTDNSHLVDRAVAGDSHALLRLLGTDWRRVEGYVRERLPQRLRGVFEPHDILQDVYQLAFRGIQTFRPQGEDAMFRWFITIARNRMAELLRAQLSGKRGGMHRQELNDGDDEQAASLLEQLAVSYRTPSKSAIRHELIQAIELSLEQIAPDYKEALRLRYFEGLGIDEIATRMNRSKGSVTMLCNRGLKELNKLLVSASRYR